MPLTANINKYKLYIGDTGLFVTLAFWDKDYILKPFHEERNNQNESSLEEKKLFEDMDKFIAATEKDFVLAL